MNPRFLNSKFQILNSTQSLIVIVGPTASGKSDLALRIAEAYGGEIIAADSRTLYKGMDIGTAKPSREDQKRAPHWGIDLIELSQDFNVHQFKNYAEGKIKDIQSRDKLPILVGGTGLYIDSVLFDYSFVDGVDSVRRDDLENLSIEELQNIIKVNNYKMPKNYLNKRHLIGIILRGGDSGTRKPKALEAALVIGILPSDDELKQRIKIRSAPYFANGLLDETRRLLKNYSEQDIKKRGGIAYQACLEVIAGHLSIEEAEQLIQLQDWQYARRQKTWFKRNKSIHWFTGGEEAFEFIEGLEHQNT